MPWTSATTRSSGFTVTAAVWNAEHVDNLDFIERVAHYTQTTDVTVTATAEGSADAVVAGTSISYEAVPHRFVFSCTNARPDNGAVGRTLTVILADGTSSLGLLCQLVTPAAQNIHAPLHREVTFTPSAASHTYNVRAFINAGTNGLIQAGAGGSSGVRFPISLTIYRVPT